MGEEKARRSRWIAPIFGVEIAEGTHVRFPSLKYDQANWSDLSIVLRAITLDENFSLQGMARESHVQAALAPQAAVAHCTGCIEFDCASSVQEHPREREAWDTILCTLGLSSPFVNLPFSVDLGSWNHGQRIYDPGYFPPPMEHVAPTIGAHHEEHLHDVFLRTSERYARRKVPFNIFGRACLRPAREALVEYVRCVEAIVIRGSRAGNREFADGIRTILGNATTEETCETARVLYQLRSKHVHAAHDEFRELLTRFGSEGQAAMAAYKLSKSVIRRIMDRSDVDGAIPDVSRTPIG